MNPLKVFGNGDPGKHYNVSDVRWAFACGIVAGVTGAGGTLAFLLHLWSMLK
jgi:hypothetical protein